MSFITMIELTYTEVRTEIREEEELYEALQTAWEEDGNSIETIDELKNCWKVYECDILDNLYSIWTTGDIEDSNLNEILTPEFWDKFYEYIENEN